MYADTLYLFGDQFVPIAKFLDQKEQIPGSEVKVNQKKLAELATLVALLELVDNKYLELSIKEGKFLFITTKSAQIKPLKVPGKELGYFETSLLQAAGDKESSVDKVIMNLLQTDSFNPWQQVLEFIKENLRSRGIFERVQDKKILFITTHKDVLKGELPKKERDQVSKVKEVLESFQNSQKELFEKVMGGISNGINAMLRQSSND